VDNLTTTKASLESQIGSLNKDIADLKVSLKTSNDNQAETQAKLEC
jgi:septal ring factor EnvC (AmiA/AmiB activator)